jgi:tetratricopeptide (TPR) repeat protein
MALLGRRGRFDAAAVSAELARAAAEAEAGQPERAGKRYAKLAKSLASAPGELPELRGLRLAALLGGAEVAADRGDAAGAVALTAQAFAAADDPAKELPLAGLRRLAEHRMRIAQGPLAAPLAYLRAAADPEQPAPVDAQAVAEVTGWLHQVCGQGPVAAKDAACAEAVAALPGVDWPVLARAAALTQGNRLGDAERLLAGAAPAGSGEIWFRWAAVLFTAGRFPQAVAAFDEALRRGAPAGAEPSPWSRGMALVGDALLFRGLAKQRLGQAEAAQADLVAAVNRNPKDPRPRDAIARLALSVGADDVAREQFEAALAVAPSYVPARLGLALLHERAGRPAQAAEDYRAALAVAPRWRPARVRLGATLAAAGAARQAVEVLGPEAGSDDVLGVAARFHLGAALLTGGDARGALERWEAIAGDDMKSHVALARDRVARGVVGADPAAARVLWQRAMSEFPIPAYRAALREATLREAAEVLLLGRDVPEARERVGKALEFARMLVEPGEDFGRVQRLTLLLGLANGQAGPVPDHVEADAPLRDRCHAAAVLLLAGRDRDAERVLALVPGEHARDAMPARLRAVLAERSGEWRIALEWHLRSLAAAAPTDALTTPPGACGGCGRESGPVFLVDESRSGRCALCVRTGLAAVLECARRAQASSEVEPVFAAWAATLGEAARATGVDTALALLRADSGDHDAALAILTPDSPVERAAVLVRRGALDLRRGRATRAVVDLREAVTLCSDVGEPVVEALGLLAEHEAFVRAGEGRWREAFEGYRSVLRDDPAHPRLLHAVGLTAYRLAASLDPADPQAEHAWSWTVGALVAGVYVPDVWGQTASVSGRGLAPGQVAKARALLLERLAEDLRALDAASGRSGDEVDAWGTRLAMEVRCAEAFAQQDLRVEVGDAPSRRLVLGPALRRLLDGHPAWRAAYEQAIAPYAAADGSGEGVLREVLGVLHPTLGAHRFLILQGRFADAAAALAALPAEERTGEQQALLAEALVREGERLYRVTAWAEALDALAGAARVGVRELTGEQVRMAADCGQYASRAMLPASPPRAVELLEQAIALCPGATAETAELSTELGAAYVAWSRQLGERGEYEDALAAAGRALEIAPGDEAALEARRSLQGGFARHLTRRDAPGDLARALELWREVLAIDDEDDEARAGLLDGLRSSARVAALAGDRVAALAFMAEAVGLDPGFEGDPVAEAPGRLATLLVEHATGAVPDGAFAERAAALDAARGFADSDAVRAASCDLGREQAAVRIEEKDFAEAERLLRDAVDEAPDEHVRQEAAAELAAAYRAHAIEAGAHRRRRGEALQAIAAAIELAPDSEDLQALRASIESLG